MAVESFTLLQNKLEQADSLFCIHEQVIIYQRQMSFDSVFGDISRKF